MQNSEFQPKANFQDRSFSPLPANHSGDIPLSIYDLDMLLDVVSEEFALIEKSTGDIKWLSYPCRNIAHKLGNTKNISEFPALKKMIEDACPGESDKKIKAKWHTKDAKWQQCIGDKRKSTVSVLVQPNRTDHIWVRFYRSNDQDEYIRESLAAHERLFNTSRELSVREIITTLSHELNQPLGTLTNIVNGLKSRLDSTESTNKELTDALDLAQRQSQFASDILQRLRDFSHNKQPVIQRFDLYEMITDTLDLLDWLFSEHSVDINLNVELPDSELHADSTLLQQVLVNLLRNAVEAMSESEMKRIDIDINKQSNHTSIAISDTGHGLKEGEEDTMFIPFNSKKTNGMGIGLNICRSFIELHQGRFQVSNNSHGGCTATITLPDRTK